MKNYRRLLRSYIGDCVMMWQRVSVGMSGGIIFPRLVWWYDVVEASIVV